MEETMHARCDNFWMYQNIRHEPVLSLSKGDSHSHAVLTDNYKPLPNGGSLNHLNSYLTPQKSVASSHQSDPSRKTDSQCVWPSSVYSLTFRSSYANNFYLPETYSSQSISLNCSAQNSQVQQNYDSRHLRNSNLNFPQVFSNTNINTTTTTTTTTAITHIHKNDNNDNNCNNNSNNSNNKNSNNSSNINCSTSALVCSSKNNNAAVPRIRVKDVFSLNNSTLCNSLYENNLLQTYQKEQRECPLKYSTMNHFMSFDSKTSAEYVDYEKVNLLESNHTYGPTTAEQTKPYDCQKFFQPSDLCYQQNMQLSAQSQFNFSHNKEKEKNLPSKSFNNNSFIRQLSDHEKICEAEVQNIQKKPYDAPFRSKRIKVQPRRNSSELSNLQNSETVGFCSYKKKTTNSPYSKSLEANEKIMHETSKISRDAHFLSHSQENLSEIDQDNSLIQVSLTEELKKCSKNGQFAQLNSKYSDNQIRGHENSLVKITIPHIGQSTFVNINDSSSNLKNPGLNLPCFLGSKNQSLYSLCHYTSRKNSDHKIKNNRFINSSLGRVNQSNSVNSEIASPSTNPVCRNPGVVQSEGNPKNGEFDSSYPLNVISSPKKLESSNESLHLKKRVGLNNHENYISHNSGGISENMIENVNSKISIEEKSQSAEAISPSVATLKAVVIKQENLNSRVENPGEQFIPENRASSQIVKIESNNEDFSLPEHESENRLLEETHPLEVDDSENNDFNKANTEIIFNSQRPGSESKLTSSTLKNAENCVKDNSTDNSENSTKEKIDFSTKNNMESKECKAKKKNSRNYKSKINKKKLNLLIQFLSEDEKRVETNTSKEEKSLEYLKQNHFINKQKKEIHLNRNRRKLSKTCIVKNKNNSREMISLISHKTARMEIFKCSSKTSEIAQSIENLDEREERLGKDSSAIDTSVDLSRNCDKINKPFQENQVQPEDCLKSESRMINISAGQKKQDISKICLLEQESSTGTKEDDMNKIVRAFQNLKTYFCMSCDLISSVDSFWINVASGELRCLNCFKKLLIQSKSEKVGSNNNSQASLVEKYETHKARENGQVNAHKTEFENKSENSSELMVEYDRQKSNNSVENISQELKEIINESSEGKLAIEKSKEMSFMSEYCTVSAVSFSNTSRRQSASIEDETSLLSKTMEEKNKLKGEESKICSKEGCACQKTHSLEDTLKKNTKPKNASKDFDQKPIISEKIKIKEKETAEKSKKKRLSSQNFIAEQKKVDWSDQSRKRKNVDEGFGTHKVRFVEERAKKEIKLVACSSQRSKDDSADRKIKILKHERQNAKDSREKSRKNNSSKEDCINFGNSVKKETNKVSDSSEKSKTKGDAFCHKIKISKHSKDKTSTSSEVPRRKSNDESISSKPVFGRSKNEKNKSAELSDNLRRNSISKEECGSVLKHFKTGGLLAENKESKTMEEKGKTLFRGKIPKKSHPDSETNINVNLRSPLNYVSEETPNVKVNKEQCKNVKEECPNGKSKRESFKNERKTIRKRKEKGETVASKKEVEAFQKSVSKIKKEIEGERKGPKRLDPGEQNAKESTEASAAEESQPSGDGSEKTMLLTELIKKTKKLSWTLLNGFL